MKTVYQADDGTTFDNVDACIIYEEAMEKRDKIANIFTDLYDSIYSEDITPQDVAKVILENQTKLLELLK